jgi:hypothetical protein
MTPAEVVALIQRVTYKPGWKLRTTVEPAVRGWGFPVVRVQLTYRAPASDGSGASVEFHGEASLSVDDRTEPDRVLAWLTAFIQRSELHEMDEWLKVDGKHVRDPHPEMLR